MNMQLNESPSLEEGKGKTLLLKIKEEILLAFNSAPSFGSVGFTIHLIEGEPTRIETYFNESRKLQPKVKREEIYEAC